MKILIINNFFTRFAGAETVFFNEASLLKDNGHDVYFFATDRKPFIDPDYELIEYFPKYIDYSKSPKSQLFKNFRNILYNSDTKKQLEKVLNILKPDIIHCHNIHYHLTPSILETIYSNKIPLVMTVHDVRLVCPGAKLLKANKKYCYEEHCITGNVFHCLLNKCKDDSLVKSLLVSSEMLFSKYKKFYLNIDMFICPSIAIEDLIIKSGISKSNTYVLPNFIPETTTIKAQTQNSGDYFFYSGRLEKYKGVETLIRAMILVPEITLHIAGKGEAETEFKNLVKSLDLQNVIFLGFLNKEELAFEYMNCTASIVPSEWFENSPLSILESFSYAKPVISSTVGGIPELIENNVTGLLFEPANINALVSKIKQLNESNKAKDMGLKALEIVNSKFNSSNHYNHLMSIYEKVIQSQANKN